KCPPIIIGQGCPSVGDPDQAPITSAHERQSLISCIKVWTLLEILALLSISDPSWAAPSLPAFEKAAFVTGLSIGSGSRKSAAAMPITVPTVPRPLLQGPSVIFNAS